MSGKFRRVRKGDPFKIPPSTYNAFCDAAEDYVRRIANAGGAGPARVAPPPQTILVRNDGGGDKDRFSVLGIDVPVILPTDNADEFAARVLVSVVAPTDAHRGRFVVLAEPLLSGAIGRAYVMGVCPAKLVVADADHEYADAMTAIDFGLVSGETGSVRILWKETGTGIKWAVVQLGADSEATHANPVSLTSGTSTTAASDTWDVATQTDDEDGVNVQIQTRTIFSTGDEKLYAFYRTLTIDSAGKVAAISSESRYTVDTLEDC